MHPTDALADRGSAVRPAAASPIPRGLPRRTGIGLKAAHLRQVLADRPDVGFFEVHAENFMVDGGPMPHLLSCIRERHALTLHGVGLSLGAGHAPDEAHLDRLAALIARYEPAAFSEHLAWSTHDGRFLNDLLPVPYDAPTLARVCRHVDRVQERLGLRMLLENPSTYVEFERSTMSEAQFLCEVVRRTGCGLLLDVTNLHVSCANHGRDPYATLDELPLQAVGQLHLAGFAVDTDAVGDPLLIDSHGSPVDDAVWRLYAQVAARLGPLPTLLERDHDVPALATLVAEAAQADAVMAGATHTAQGHRPRSAG